MTRWAGWWRRLIGAPAELRTAGYEVEAAHEERARAEAHLDELRRRLLHVEADLMERSEWEKKKLKP